MKTAFSYSILVFGVLALSTSAIFVRLAAAPAAITAFYRLFFALVVLLPTVLFRKIRRDELKTLPKKSLLLALLSGALLAVHYILWFESLRFTSVTSSTVIVTLQPVFSIWLGVFFLKERHRIGSFIGCGIALAGSFVIGFGDFTLGGTALFGDLLAFAATAFIGVYYIIGQLLRRTLSAEVYSVLGYTGSTVFLAVYALIVGDSFLEYSPQTWACFIGLALVSTIMGQFIFNLLLKYLSAATISVSILGEPVGTCILAFFLLNERIAPKQFIGMVIIFFGIMLYLYNEAKSKKQQ